MTTNLVPLNELRPGDRIFLRHQWRTVEAVEGNVVHCDGDTFHMEITSGSVARRCA